MRYLPAPQAHQRSLILGVLGGDPAAREELPPSLQVDVNGIIQAGIDKGGDPGLLRTTAEASALEGYKCGWRRGAILAGILALLVGGGAGYYLALRMAKKEKKS